MVTLIFGNYAIATSVAVGVVIFLIFRMTAMAGRFQKEWIESMVMRVAGCIIVVFLTLWTLFCPNQLLMESYTIFFSIALASIS